MSLNKEILSYCVFVRNDNLYYLLNYVRRYIIFLSILKLTNLVSYFKSWMIYISIPIFEFYLS